MSDANRTQLAYVEEVTFGTTPSAALKVMRWTGETLAQDTTTVTSQEIRSDRQISKIIKTGAEAKGDITIEMSATSHDDLLKGALQSSGWSSPVSQTIANLTFAAGSGSYTITRAAGSYVTDGYAVNQWVKISNAVNAGNNGYGKISALTATVMTISHNGNGVNETLASGGQIIMGAQIVNGTTLTSFSFERKYNDISNTFAALLGMCINSLALSIPTGQLITGSFGFMGQKEENETATIGNGTYTAAPTTDVMSATNDLQLIMENGTRFDVTKLDINLNNNLRTRNQVGYTNPISVGSGSAVVSGTISAYFTSNAIIAKNIDFTSTSLSVLLKDAAGNAVVFDIPEVKITNAKRNGSAINTDVMAELTWSASMDPTELITIRIAKF